MQPTPSLVPSLMTLRAIPTLTAAIATKGSRQFLRQSLLNVTPNSWAA